MAAELKPDGRTDRPLTSASKVRSGWAASSAALCCLRLRLFAPLAPGYAASTGTLVLKTETGDHNFNIEVATTDQERALGLMFRRSLPENAGMLFLYEQPQPAAMWMKNTLIPLDMVFICPRRQVHRIETNTEPFSTRSIPSGRRHGRGARAECRPGRQDRAETGDKVVYPGLAKGTNP